MEDHKLELHFDELIPLRDVVFNTLREGILTGELKPGERLMEIHLANKLGVSRTPIREAIRMLELEGLVTMIPRRGAEVANISRRDLEEVLEVRRALDELAVTLACLRITDEEIVKLEEAAKEFERFTKGQDATTIANADVKFHEVILMASKNSQLTQMVNNLAERVYRYRLEYIKDSSKHERLISEHTDILEAVRNRDAEKAKRIVGLHIDNQEKTIIDRLNEG